MRAFIAIELPAGIKDALSGMQTKSPKESISWVKSQNLHLTLKFLGDISLEQLNKIKQLIIGITKTIPGFKIKLNNLGVFPNMHTTRIIWIGADHPPLELKQLTEQLETKLAGSGTPQEQRTFRAHITIGRIRSHLVPSDLKKVIDKIENDMAGLNWEFNCDEITLFESTLGPGGPVYTILDKFNLLI